MLSIFGGLCYTKKVVLSVALLKYRRIFRKSGSNQMKATQAELKRIFKKNPVGIIFVLTLDIAEIVCLSLNPLVIGLCIDGFFERSYFWLYVLILLQLLLIVVRTINKFSDNRVYEPIIEDERNSCLGCCEETS